MTQGLANTLVEKVKGAGDLNIAVRSWRPEGNARGVIVIVPGFNSHSGYYAWAAAQLTAGDSHRRNQVRTWGLRPRECIED